MPVAKVFLMLILLSYAPSAYAWSGKVFSVNGKTITVATTDSSKTKIGMIVYIVAEGKEIGRARVGKAFHTKIEAVLQSGKAEPGNLVTDSDPTPATLAKKEQVKPETVSTVKKISPAAFLSFCGLNFGDSEDQLLKILGTPEESEGNGDSENDFAYRFYFNKGLRISVHNSQAKPSQVGKVTVVWLQSADAVEKIRALGIKDEKLDLFGLHHEEITKRFGEPQSKSHDSYSYDFDVSGRGGVVTFYCYERWQYKCNMINVHWFPK